MFGSYHNTLWGSDHIQILDWKISGNMDIKIAIDNDIYSNIKIRMAPTSLSNAILKLDSQLATLNNRYCCRGTKVGDIGKMYALGCKSNGDEFVLSKRHIELHDILEEIGILKTVFLEFNFLLNMIS